MGVEAGGRRGRGRAPGTPEAGVAGAPARIRLGRPEARGNEKKKGRAAWRCPPRKLPHPTTSPPPDPHSYKAHFRWEHWAGPPPVGLPTETESCPSVTSAFLQVRPERRRAREKKTTPGSESEEGMVGAGPARLRALLPLARPWPLPNPTIP